MHMLFTTLLFIVGTKGLRERLLFILCDVVAVAFDAETMLDDFRPLFVLSIMLMPPRSAPLFSSIFVFIRVLFDERVNLLVLFNIMTPTPTSPPLFLKIEKLENDTKLDAQIN